MSAPDWGAPPWERRRRDWRERRRFRRPLRRSIRVRLTWAFVILAWIMLWAGYGFARYGPGHNAGHGAWGFPSLFLAFVAAAVFGAFSARRITDRLSRLNEATERMTLRDLSVRVPVEGDDEVAALARTFNLMVDRLQAEEGVRRHLVADVAHELRHPLAVLSGRLESMQDGVLPLDHEQVLHLQDMVIALTRLVGDLRDLSLADVGQLSLSLGPVDLRVLVGELCENMEPVAADRGVRLHADVAPGVGPVTGDPDRIRQVLVNLLANAIRFTPAAGEVGVAVAEDGPDVRIDVTDTGPGIAPDRIAHVFDRFYRADDARSRAEGSGGSGLGLAIVRSLVELHGGTVMVHSPAGGGTRFTVRLPRRGPAPREAV